MKNISILSFICLILTSFGVCERPLTPYEYIQINSKANPYVRKVEAWAEYKTPRQLTSDQNDKQVFTADAPLIVDLTDNQMSGNYSKENTDNNNTLIESRLESNISNVVTNDTKSALISILHHFVDRYPGNDNSTNRLNPQPDNSPDEEEYSTDLNSSSPFYDFESYMSSR